MSVIEAMVGVVWLGVHGAGAGLLIGLWIDEWRRPRAKARGTCDG